MVRDRDIQKIKKIGGPRIKIIFILNINIIISFILIINSSPILGGG